MHILFFLLLLFIIIIIAGLSIVGAVFRAIFGIGRRSPKRNGNYTNPHESTYNPYGGEQHTESNPNTPSSDKHKKIFAKDEGEYVDFEEVKQDQ